jgi:hypothetical protein
MSHRFNYLKYDKIAVDKQESLKELFEKIESFCKKNFPDTRESKLILIALEEAYMWTGKAIRNDQIVRDGGETDHRSERG